MIQDFVSYCYCNSHCSHTDGVSIVQLRPNWLQGNMMTWHAAHCWYICYETRNEISKCSQKLTKPEYSSPYSRAYHLVLSWTKLRYSTWSHSVSLIPILILSSNPRPNLPNRLVFQISLQNLERFSLLHRLCFILHPSHSLNLITRIVLFDYFSSFDRIFSKKITIKVHHKTHKYIYKYICLFPL
jgi:hypothetical protein